jgi:TonB-linked SusC/RagA family outer membrane protein
VSGVVTDQSGLPIPGVNVLVKGSKAGTQTDVDGKFKVADAQGKTLVFSFTGMKTVEALAVNGMKVKMADSSAELKEVVVTALGIKRQKKALGFGTVTVSSKDLTEVNNTGVFESLSGKLAGVDVVSPAQVGASTKVIIRGFSSLANNDPLYVIDGTPINNSSNGSSGENRNRRTFDAGNGINDIDPTNIESMTILKGAAATALYGSRAGSGAIIITTKSGKNNQKIKVDFTTSYDISQVARVPHLQYKYGQGWLGQGYSGFPTHGVAVSSENGSWGPAFDGKIRPYGTIFTDANGLTSQQIKPYVGLPTNIRDFYDFGNTITNNFRVSGGGENSTFSIGFSDVNSDGIIPTDSDSYKRRNVNFSGGVTSNKLDVKVDLNFVKKDQSVVNTGSGDDAGEGATLVAELLQIPSDFSVVDLKDYENNPFNTPSNYFTPYASNPYFTLGENSTKIDGKRLYGNVNLNYKFNKQFNLVYQIGGDLRNEKIKSYGAKVDYLAGSSQLINGANKVVGGVTENNSDRSELDSYLNLNYNTSINDDFKIIALIGGAANQRKLDFLQGRITNLDLPDYYELTNSAEKPVLSQSNVLRKNFGVYSSAELSFRDKLYLTLTGRYDWTSTLPVGLNAYFYPSATLSAIAIDNKSTFLKLRAGIAKVSKDTNAYETESSYTQAIAGQYSGSLNFPFGGVNAYEFDATLGNNTLKPETTTEFELGFESSFFTKRVILDLSVYNKKTTDLIYLKDISSSTGFRRQSSNILDVSNKGIEISLNIIPIKTANFTWNLNTNFTKNLSNVDDVYSGTKIRLTTGREVDFSAVEGKPLGTFEAFIPKVNSKGEYIVNKDTGYYTPTDEKQEIGTSQRDFSVGVQNRVTYKNFSLSAGLDWKQGGEMFSESKYLAYFTGNGIETTYNDRNGFIIPNSVNEVITGGVQTFVENTTPIYSQTGAGKGTVTGFYNSQNNAIISKDFIVSKTFVRLRDISITYNLPNKLIKNTGLTNVSFSLYGKNLALWTPNENAYVDPEISTFGTGVVGEFGESFATPSQRVYGTTIKLTF